MSIDDRKEKVRKLVSDLGDRFRDFNWQAQIRMMPDLTAGFWQLWDALDRDMALFIESSDECENEAWDFVKETARELYVYVGFHSAD